MTTLLWEAFPPNKPKARRFLPEKSTKAHELAFPTHPAGSRCDCGLFGPRGRLFRIFMRERFQRYAIYWTPPPGAAMAKFGLLWFSGCQTFGLKPGLVRRAIKAPAVYGLHATFKAPFRLKQDAAPERLSAELDAFCAMRRAPRSLELRLDLYQHYLTLVIKAGQADVDWLAAECVTSFDRFREASDEEEVRGGLESLSCEEETYLREFGYPWVLSAFRFHISLAGPLYDHELGEVAAALEPHLTPFLSEPFEVGGLSLLGEPCSGGAYEVISRHPLRR